MKIGGEGKGLFGSFFWILIFWINKEKRNNDN